MRHTLPILSALLLLSLPAFADAPPIPTYELKITLPVGEDGGWDYITIDPATDQLYVPRGNRVLVLDVNVDKPSAPKTSRILATLPDTPGVHGVALSNPELHRAYVSNGKDASVSIFDTHTFKLITKVSAGEKPDAILFDPFTKKVFSMNGKSKNITAFPADAATGKILAAPTVGGRLDAAAFDPELQLAFASSGEGTLALVHENTPDTFSAPVIVKTLAKARTCALNPKNHYVYLPTTDADKKFVILILAPKPVGK